MDLLAPPVRAPWPITTHLPTPISAPQAYPSSLSTGRPSTHDQAPPQPLAPQVASSSAVQTSSSGATLLTHKAVTAVVAPPPKHGPQPSGQLPPSSRPVTTPAAAPPVHTAPSSSTASISTPSMNPSQQQPALPPSADRPQASQESQHRQPAGEQAQGMQSVSTTMPPQTLPVRSTDSQAPLGTPARSKQFPRDFLLHASQRLLPGQVLDIWMTGENLDENFQAIRTAFANRPDILVGADKHYRRIQQQTPNNGLYNVRVHSTLPRPMEDATRTAATSATRENKGAAGGESANAPSAPVQVPSEPQSRSSSAAHPTSSTPSQRPATPPWTIANRQLASSATILLPPSDEQQSQPAQRWSPRPNAPPSQSQPPSTRSDTSLSQSGPSGVPPATTVPPKLSARENTLIKDILRVLSPSKPKEKEKRKRPDTDDSGREGSDGSSKQRITTWPRGVSSGATQHAPGPKTNDVLPLAEVTAAGSATAPTLPPLPPLPPKEPIPSSSVFQTLNPTQPIVHSKPLADVSLQPTTSSTSESQPGKRPPPLPVTNLPTPGQTPPSSALPQRGTSPVGAPSVNSLGLKRVPITERNLPRPLFLPSSPSSDSGAVSPVSFGRQSNAYAPAVATLERSQDDYPSVTGSRPDSPPEIDELAEDSQEAMVVEGLVRPVSTAAPRTKTLEFNHRTDSTTRRPRLHFPNKALEVYVEIPYRPDIIAKARAHKLAEAHRRARLREIESRIWQEGGEEAVRSTSDVPVADHRELADIFPKSNV